jgi:Glycosyl hydrolases family 16
LLRLWPETVKAPEGLYPCGSIGKALPEGGFWSNRYDLSGMPIKGVMTALKNARPAMPVPALLLSAVITLSCATGARAAESATPETLVLEKPNGPVSLSCAQAAKDEPVVMKTLNRSFFEDFTEFKLPSQRWETHYEGDGRKRAMRTHYDSPNETQVYADPDFAGTADRPLGINPFKILDGNLRISAAPTPLELRKHLYNLPFISGMITTRRSFAQLYGYFEISARFSRMKGAWPAFWLLQPHRWPPEIDVFEGMDRDAPNRILITSHWRDPLTREHKQSYCWADVADPEQEFHRYGVLWLPDRIVHYLDRRPVSEIKTPPGMDTRMYMIANLAVTPAASETNPAPMRFDIAWIAAYALKEPPRRGDAAPSGPDGGQNGR